MKENQTERAAKQPGIYQEILSLLLKIFVTAAVFVLLFTFVFGINRTHDNTMSPAIQNGDMILFYRLDRQFRAAEAVVVEYEGEKQERRVAAVAGDTVDITEEGLVINGALQSERGIYTETLPYVDGISFPVKVKENQVFLLADHRDGAVDSRIYGPVEINQILGKVVTVIRKRDI